MFHKGFYTRKSILRHKLIMWLSEGKETPAKKMVGSLKKIYTKIKPR
jgi:hypothetical protein